MGIPEAISGVDTVALVVAAQKPNVVGEPALESSK